VQQISLFSHMQFTGSFRHIGQIIAKNKLTMPNGTTYVFLCFTESGKDGDDVMKEKHPSVTEFTDTRF
jgi:hypothetical protein